MTQLQQLGLYTRPPRASGAAPGLCMDLDGTSTDFSFHDTGFSVYITPVSVVRHQVIIIGERLGCIGLM